MHPDVVVPDRFAPITAAMNETLVSLSTRADRAELLVAVMQTYETWLRENVHEDARAPLGTMATEHETAETLRQAIHDYWTKCMAQ